MNKKDHKNISVNYEWGVLKEAIVGISPRDSIVIEEYYPGVIWANNKLMGYCKKYGGRNLFEVDPQMAIKIEKQVDNFAKFLESLGITVHRNNNLIAPEEKTYLTPQAEGTLPYVRDPIIVINNMVFEASLKMICRRRERYSIRPLLQKILPSSSTKWLSVPPPSPIQDEYDTQSIFLEGGDILVNGSEIYVGISGCASNESGVAWLQQYLGPEYKIHAIHLAPNILHLDCVISLINPHLGIIYWNGIESTLPESLKNLEFIDISNQEAEMLASNVCILDKHTVIIDTNNLRVADELRKRKLEVIPLPCDGPIFFGGGFRCLHHPLNQES